MALLSKQDQEHLKEAFRDLSRSVKLVMFTQELECEYCRETRQIVEELADISSQIKVEVYDFVGDKPQAEAYGIDKIPAVAIVTDGEQSEDYGIRYYGIPSGYEFASLVEDVVMVGRGESKLSDATKTALAQLDRPVHIQVFVTPTCPYCPQAVHLAHQMAMESAHIRADMVEAIEFPYLANKYNVMGVPRTVISETIHVEGAVPEHVLLPKVLEASKA